MEFFASAASLWDAAQQIAGDRPHAGRDSLQTVAGRHPRRHVYWAPLGVCNISITWSSEKLAAFWRGGYALNVARKFPT